MDVFAVGPDNAVWVKAWDQGWTPWTSMNGTLKGGTVFCVGSKNEMSYRALQGEIFGVTGSPLLVLFCLLCDCIKYKIMPFNCL
jgi:hypothetical protein